MTGMRRERSFLLRTFSFLREPSCKDDCGLTQPAPEVPFLSKRKEPKIRQRGSVLFGNTSEGKTAPLLSALPYFFVCGPENGQSPFSELFCIPSGTSQAKFSPPVCSASRRMSGIAPTTSGSRVPSLRVLTIDKQSGFQKGFTPFVKLFKLPKSNQEVFGTPLITFLVKGK